MDDPSLRVCFRPDFVDETFHIFRGVVRRRKGSNKSFPTLFQLVPLVLPEALLEELCDVAVFFPCGLLYLAHELLGEVDEQTLCGLYG